MYEVELALPPKNFHSKLTAIFFEQRSNAQATACLKHMFRETHKAPVFEIRYLQVSEAIRT
jgi:hypothetical protein